jgi:hypothetical protein
VLLVAALLGPVALRNALTLEVSDVRFDGTIVFALAFVGDMNVRTAGLAGVAIGLSVDATDGGVDLGAAASFADAFTHRRS